MKTPTWSKPVSCDERLELGEVGLGLAREPDDEGGPERDARNALADPREQLVVGLPVARPAHALQHVRRRVLQRQVDVAAHLLALRHRVEHVVGDRRRVEVEEADPA